MLQIFIYRCLAMLAYLHRLLGCVWLCAAEEQASSGGQRERSDQPHRTLEQHFASESIAFGQEGVVVLEEAGQPSRGVALLPTSLQPFSCGLTITLHLYPGF